MFLSLCRKDEQEQHSQAAHSPLHPSAGDLPPDYAPAVHDAPLQPDDPDQEARHPN